MPDFPKLGAGLGFRAPYISDVFLHREEIDFLEVIADHYFDPTPEKRRELELLADHFPLVPHGLNLSLGSAEGLDKAYAQKFAALVDRLAPPWWSEHLAFTQAGGVEIGHLAPLPYTREAVEAVCKNIREIAPQINAPLLLENITYAFALPGAEMTEAQFLAEIVERADCGILLDVANLYTNSVNHGFDIGAFLDAIPLERVVQLHFVGGEWQGDTLLDTHSQATPDEVWDVMRLVLERAPVKGVLLERDENLPPIEELLSELRKTRRIWQESAP